MDKRNKRGRPKSEKSRKTVSLSVEPQAWELLAAKAREMGLTRSDLVEMLATEGNTKLLGESSAN